MTLNFQDGWGIHGLDQNQHSDRWQFAVKSGCAVSPGTNDLTVQCNSGDAIFNGSSVSVSAQDNVSLQAADSSDPRKDVVYLDSNGSLTVATGTAEAAKPSGKVREKTYRPAPPDLSATNAVILAEIWVPAGASDITTSDVRDRRQLADLAAKSVNTERVNDERHVTTEAELDQAIADGAEVIRINGPITGLSEKKTYDVDGGRIVGFGRWWSPDDEIKGDGIRGSVSGALLDLTGSEQRVYGIAVHNPATDGVAVSCSSGSRTQLRDCWLSAGLKGYESTSNSYEDTLEGCRLFCTESAQAGSIGIHMNGPTDTEIHHNKVLEFDVAIDADTASPHHITHNHCYGGSVGTAGIKITNGEVSHNYVEGSGGISDAGIIIGADGTTAIGNDVLVGDSADGIRVVGDGGQVYDIKVVHNILSSLGTGNEEVNAQNVTGWNRSDVHSNGHGADFAAAGANGTVSQHVTL